MRFKNSGATAITRRSPSLPLRLLLKAGLIPSGSCVLDYGCGQGKDVAYLRECCFQVQGYDKNWQPERPKGKFDVIIATYVLNVISAKEAKDVLCDIQKLLKVKGCVFVTVRRDIQKGGSLSQRWVSCPKGYKVIKENTKIAMFKLGSS